MGVLENLAKNPAVLAIAALGIVAFIFRDKISDFLSNITGGAETANILGENLLSNLQGTQDLLNNITSFFTNFEFPTFEFPTFEFPNLFGNGEEPTFSDEPSEEPTTLPGGPGIGPVEFPEGCFINSQGLLDCPSPPTFDACAENPGLPQCQPEQPAGPSIIGGGPTDPICVDVPLITGGSFNTCTGEFTPTSTFIGPPEPPSEPEPDVPFEPPIDLPPGFTGGGPSFQGGTIFETDICNKSIGQIAAENGISASAAADMKFQACETSDFDFGTNTGSGFGPGDDPTGPIVTGGATLASEEQRAACISCELFGLNCPICQGRI